MKQFDVLDDERRGHVEDAVARLVGHLGQPAPVGHAQFIAQRPRHNGQQRLAQRLRRVAQILRQQLRAGGLAVAGGEERADL